MYIYLLSTSHKVAVKTFHPQSISTEASIGVVVSIRLKWIPITIKYPLQRSCVILVVKEGN